MPLPELTADRAAALVVEHLVNRTRSRRSRRKRQPYTGHNRRKRQPYTGHNP